MGLARSLWLFLSVGLLSELSSALRPEHGEATNVTVETQNEFLCPKAGAAGSPERVCSGPFPDQQFEFQHEGRRFSFLLIETSAVVKDIHVFEGGIDFFETSILKMSLRRGSFYGGMITSTPSKRLTGNFLLALSERVASLLHCPVRLLEDAANAYDATCGFAVAMKWMYTVKLDPTDPKSGLSWYASKGYLPCDGGSQQVEQDRIKELWSGTVRQLFESIALWDTFGVYRDDVLPPPEAVMGYYVRDVLTTGCRDPGATYAVKQVLHGLSVFSDVLEMSGQEPIYQTYRFKRL